MLGHKHKPSESGLTILTDPMPVQELFFKGWLYILLRFLRDRIKPPKQNYNRSKYRGHPAVTRSLVEGLRKLNYDFNYNPLLIREVNKNVLVLSGVETLRQAIKFKKLGIIDRLYAGPNIVVFASDHDSILASPEIDFVVTPCDWVIDVYLEDCPELKGKIISWPAGVDISYWRPMINRLNSKQVLIYEKQNKGKVGPIDPYVNILERFGFNVKVVKYGSFTHDEYLRWLNESIFMVGFVTDESQGLAWAEAWSCDIPTFIWKNTSHIYRGRKYACSTAPYLSDQTGLFFNDLQDFTQIISGFLESKYVFSPRNWVLSNMSDEVCAQELYNHILNKC
jgi:hypothetical protein